MRLLAGPGDWKTVSWQKWLAESEPQPIETETALLTGLSHMPTDTGGIDEVYFSSPRLF